METLDRFDKIRKYVLNSMDFIVLVLSVWLIVWISVDTFREVEFLRNHAYMTFQFWVCIFFMLDFFVELGFRTHKWRFFRSRFLFLLLSIPYLNIINILNIDLGHDALYFLRFIPLARGALAMSIVIGYLSSNAISSMFISYISIMVLIVYFCSLIIFQREHPVNPEMNSYWTALWWCGMNLTTVGSAIAPLTPSGKIIAVALPICGMIMFPLFTVYLTSWVSGKTGRTTDASADENAPAPSDKS